MPQRIEISYKTIVFTVFFIIGLWLVAQILDIILLILLSVVAAAGLRPIVEKIESFRVPRVIAILITYVFLVIILILVVSSFIPLVMTQTNKLISQLAYFFSFLAPYTNFSAENLSNQIAPLGSNIFKATLSVFSTVVDVFTFFALAFYLLLERRYMRVFLRNIFGEDLKERIVDILLKIEDRLGAWVRGQVSLMLIVGTMTYIGLTLLGVEFALPLALIAGFLELVPIIGPIISAVPAVIVAWLISPWLALATGALYFLVQQLENNLIVPVVMRRAVGVPPMISIVAILIGAQLLGFVGIILAIPFFVSVQVVFQEVILKQEK